MIKYGIFIEGRKGRFGNASFEKEIIDYAISIGIDKIGFATAAPFTTLKARLIRQQELNYQSGFEESDIDKRTNPALLLTIPNRSFPLLWPIQRK